MDPSLILLSCAIFAVSFAKILCGSMQSDERHCSVINDTVINLSMIAANRLAIGQWAVHCSYCTVNYLIVEEANELNP